MARFYLLSPKHNRWDRSGSTYALVDTKLGVPCLFWPKNGGFWGQGMERTLNDLDADVESLRRLVRSMGREVDVPPPTQTAPAAGPDEPSWWRRLWRRS